MASYPSQREEKTLTIIGRDITQLHFRAESPVSKWFMVASMDHTSLLMYPDNKYVKKLKLIDYKDSY